MPKTTRHGEVSKSVSSADLQRCQQQQFQAPTPDGRHIPTVSCFFYNFIYALLNVTSSAATFCFFPAIWSLQASSLFWLSIYVKRHMGSPLGDKEATQLRALLSLLNDQLSDQSSPTGFKEVTWFVTDHDTICFLYTDLWSNELAAKFIPHEIAVLTEI